MSHVRLPQASRLTEPKPGRTHAATKSTTSRGRLLALMVKIRFISGPLHFRRIPGVWRLATVGWVASINAAIASFHDSRTIVGHLGVYPLLRILIQAYPSWRHEDAGPRSRSMRIRWLISGSERPPGRSK